MTDNCEVSWTVAIRSPMARQFADLLLPAANQLSFLPYHAKEVMPADQYDDIMAAINTIISAAYKALEVDRHVLAAKQTAISIGCPVELIYGPESKRLCLCNHPSSHNLFQILHDLIELDEQWCAFAWNADLVDISTLRQVKEEEFFVYLKKQREWLNRMRQLSFEIKPRVKTLKNACRSKPAATPINSKRRKHHE